MKRTVFLAFYILLLIAAVAHAQNLPGGGGGGGLPVASGSGQCVVSSAAGVNYTAGSCGSGNLPTLGSGGTVLFQNAAGTAATWATCAGDVTCSAVTPGSYTVAAIRGHTVKAGGLTDAQFYVFNNANSDLEAVTISGNGTMTNAGVLTISSVAITGGTNGDLAKFNVSGNLVNAVSGTDYAPAPTGAANTPLFNAGSGGLTNGTRSGNTTKVVTTTGTLTSGDSVSIDVNGNFIDSGFAGGPGTTNNAAQYDVPYYSAAGSANTLSGVAISGLQLDSTTGVPAAYGGASCTSQAITAMSAAGVPTCTTITSAFTDTSIAHTGADINTSNQVTVTHLAAALPVAQGGTGVTAAQGNGSKVQLSTGTTTNGDCVKYDVNGNTVDNGSACGSGGGGSGTVSSSNAQAPAYFTGSAGASSTTVAGSPNTFHIVGTNLTDAIFTALTTDCLDGSNNPIACDIILDPGTTDTETGPDLVGYVNAGGGAPPQQTLILDNAHVVFNGGHATGTWPGPFPQDDGLVLGPNGSLQCIGHGNGTVGITDNSSAHLNSIVTTLGGVVLNQWIATKAMARGEFIYDSTSNTVQRILTCSGTCTTGSSLPTFSTTRYATTVDNAGGNQVTWQNINGTGRFNLTSSNADIQGCYIYASQGGQTNNTWRVSGTTGALAVARNIAAIGVGTGTGSDDTTGSDAILFDQPQQNGFCTGNGTPLTCCTGNNAGNCQNGSLQGSGSLLTIQGLWSQPNGGITSGNPGYLVRFNGNGSGLIDIEGGQISDLGTSAASNNLVADMSIDGGVRHVTFNNFYFESSSGQGNVPPDEVVVNNATDINFTGVTLAGTGGLTNALHITNSGTGSVFFRGTIAGTSNATNAIKNDIDSYTLAAGASGLPVVYDYGPSGASTLGYIMDGRTITFNNGLTLSSTAITGVQGNAASLQLASGATVNGDLIKYDSHGNAIDSGVLASSVGSSNFNTAVATGSVAYSSILPESFLGGL